MLQTHRLSPEFTYRREHFGGVLYSATDHQTRFFNHGAAYVLEEFAKPSSQVALQDLARECYGDEFALASFVDRLTDERIIVRVHAPARVLG